MRDKIVHNMKRAGIVKLLKLTIPKLEDAPQDYFQLWAQFENKIDKAHKNPVSKYFLSERAANLKKEVINK